MAEFNLIDKLWIPCIDLRGKQVEYGIRETLLKAHELREICDDSPLVTVAIHRLLLAILYRTLQGPTNTSEWKALYEKESFGANSCLADYLTKWQDRFFLFDDAHPFMQAAGLDLNEYKDNSEVKKDKSDGLMRLSKEAPDKGGRILFDHRVGTERLKYEPKQIVKMILASQSYAGTGVASGGKIGSQVIRPTACQFAPCVDGLILWLQGENLFQTLVLNLVPYEVCKNDIPAWEDDNIIQSAIGSWKAALSFTGPVQRFAPLSRFIRAVDKKSVFFTNGLKTSADSDDPMKAYYRESDSKPYVAVKLLEHKAAWRDAHSLLAVGTVNRKPPASLNLAARIERDGVIDPGARFRAHVVGLATRRDKGLLWRHERMPIPAALLSDVNLIERLGGLLQNGEQGAIEINTRIRRISKLYLSPSCESAGARQPDKNEVNKVVNAIDPRPVYWAQLEKHFFVLLENLLDDWDKKNDGWKPDNRQTATRTWQEHVKREAQRALEQSVRSLGTSARAIQAIARVRTNFSDDDLKPAAQRQRKAKRKGGKKE